MTFLLVVVLILDILLWRVVSGLEWSIPLKWQARIEAWKEGLTSRTQTLNYVWYLSPRNSELEKQFWHLKMVLPGLRKKFRVPVWIEVSIHQSVDPRQKGIYISCLQRRFPELDIYEGGDIYELFSDVN
ncbi:MAG TPA: hypothetical protein VN456_05040 [Desulfosporosinus sp.]|nr:hypothetical protein [Desulfosporosinus sp.]